jgi:chemotaxis protein MotA
MDFATILGLLLGIGALLGSFLMEGGRFSALFQGPAMFLVLVGTFGATCITTNFEHLRSVPSLFRIVLMERRIRPAALIDFMLMLSQRARKNGFLSLERELETIKEPFLRKALQLVIDGFETSKIREILEIELAFSEERHQAGAAFFRKMGGFSPTLGIMGTVLGLIHALSNMENSSNMASAIAGAFIATLWGVALANLVYLPISDKLRQRHLDEAINREIICEGVIALAAGESPRILKTKLMSYLIPSSRREGGI